MQEIRATALPYVREVLTHLRVRKAHLGIATGNLERIGTMKLKAAGVHEYFSVGGWSDEYEHRADVFGGAVQLMLGLAGPGAAICVVGDTPADVRAAHENGLPVIAVCTGVYSRRELLEAGPDLCLDSFAELFGDGDPLG